MQSVPITALVCEFKSCSWRGELDSTLCDKVCQRLAQVCGFVQAFSSINKTDSHNITEIFLKVALNIITLTPIQTGL
jgi:hypothetical protein